MCPNCGYCRYCGRGGWGAHWHRPVLPAPPVHPVIWCNANDALRVARGALGA